MQILKILILNRHQNHIYMYIKYGRYFYKKIVPPIEEHLMVSAGRRSLFGFKHKTPGLQDKSTANVQPYPFVCKVRIEND